MKKHLKKHFFLKLPDINECSSSPCQNGGNCTDQVNGYECNCTTGYEGTNCGTGIMLTCTLL